MRTFKFYQKISSDVKPPFYELLNKIYKLGYDSQLYNLLRYLLDEMVAEDNECRIKISTYFKKYFCGIYGSLFSIIQAFTTGVLYARS